MLKKAFVGLKILLDLKAILLLIGLLIGVPIKLMNKNLVLYLSG